jgi:molecular chaperone DnaK (HSP70)
MVSEGRSLGNFEMDGIPPAPRGVPQIEIVFEVPKTGILSVKAIDKATGYTKAIEIGKLHSH